MTSSGEALWKNTLQALQDKIGKSVFQTWLEATEVESFNGQEIVIKVPTSMAHDYIKQHFLELIEHTLSLFSHGPLQVRFTLAKQTQSRQKTPATTQDPASAPDMPFQTMFNPKFTFESFVIGNRNKLAHAASISVSERPAQNYNPFFMYGGVGLGKTHLMHAIAQRAMELNPSAKVFYVTSETFVREFVTALQTNKVNEFRNRYRKLDILLIDDIQFISGKEAMQEEFFHTFNTLHGEHKQIVITSDRPPKDIPDLEDRLRSRFSGGLLIDIKPPEFETRVAILLKKAKAEGIDIPDESVHLIASKIAANVRELEGALIRVHAYSSMMNRDIDPALTEAALADLVPENTKRPITPTEIQKAVCTHYHLRLDDMRGRSRQKDIAFPRQLAMYLTRELTDLSLPKIGAEFGGRDHTTVIHACVKVERDLETDPHLPHVVRHLKETLLSNSI